MNSVLLISCDFDNDDELHAAKKGQTKAISRARIDSYQEALSKTVQGFAEDSRFADALRGSNHSVEDLARSTSDEHFHLPLDDRSRSEFFYELNKNVRKSFGIGRGRPEIAIVFKAFNQKVWQQTHRVLEI